MQLKTILSILCMFIIIGCGNSQEGIEEANTTKPVNEMTALQQMEIAFEGGYTVQQIKPVMDKALELYGVPTNEENYSRAASTLIVLRKENGTREMDILDYMIRSYVPGVKVQFPEAAAISSVFLVSGDK